MTAEERIQKAIELGLEYGSIDGGHHKMWTIDQMIRILTDCPAIALKAMDVRGEPYDYMVLGKSDQYLVAVREHCAGVDGPDTYDWDEGIAP